MYNLLTINNITCPHIDKGSITVSKDDTYNTYTGEDGYSTIEAVRSGRTSVSVSYKGLLEDDVKLVVGAITLVSSVVVYDPATDTTLTIASAKITKVKMKKILYDNNVSAWSLSFQIEEL